MVKRWLTILCLGVAMVSAGCVVAPPQPALVTVAPVPPAPVTEVVPAQPGSAYVWVPGHWAWRPRRAAYAWVAGHWAVPPGPRHAWVPGHWAQQGNAYLWVDGHWQVR